MTLAILNVGDGDTKITFDKSKPEEVERSRRIVADMLRLGYAIFVKVGDSWSRATAFNPESDEYSITDVPVTADSQTAVVDKPVKRRGRQKRIPAATTQAVGVARSAGGMSTAADSVEMRNLEKFNAWAEARNLLRKMAAEKEQWAGLPMPLDDVDLIVHPSYPFAEVLTKPTTDDGEESARITIHNRFRSARTKCYYIVFSVDGGKRMVGLDSLPTQTDIQIRTMAVSKAWGIAQEANALQLLATLLPHHAFKDYLLTGAFLERSKRSGVYYFFRKLRPTLAAVARGETMKTLCALCAHPIAYYASTWAGAMCPTDDVIAHLMMMRGDEHLFWKRCNQHPAWAPEAGI